MTLFFVALGVLLGVGLMLGLIKMFSLAKPEVDLKRAEKSYHGFGISPKVKFLGIRKELWTDGEVHEVAAYQGVDRRVWVRFAPNPGFRAGRLHWCRAYGWRKH